MEVIAEHLQEREEQEKRIILREYRALLRALKLRIKKGDRDLLRRAFEIAADAHKETRRKSGEPYILHPLAVARIVVEEIGLGVTSSICALLHDVVEDTELTLEDISREFGEQYAKIIDGLTKISNVVDLKAETTMQAENFRKILLTLADDPRVILIKLADRLHNMRTMDSMSREKQLKISSETTYIYSPLAHRLGLYEIKSELEDLALEVHAARGIYGHFQRPEGNQAGPHEVHQRVYPPAERRTGARRAWILRSMAAQRPCIPSGTRCEKSTLRLRRCTTFLRSASSSIRRLTGRKQIAGRYILSSPTITAPAQSASATGFRVPKGNGYEALHTTVMGPGGRWVEVQIRSERMNEIAEKGLAAHWKYKEGATPQQAAQESKLDHFLKHIRDVLSNPETDTLDFLSDFKLEVFTEEIYLYTPKGELRVLPKGATALDFAFDVHSALGARCIGAKVNHRLVPLSYTLKSGDQVEIITSAKQKPSEDWLAFVTTGKAKSRIKYYLKEEKRVIAEEGKAVLQRKLSHMGVDLTPTNINELCLYFKKASMLDLFYGISVGAIEIKDLKEHFNVVGDRLVLKEKEVKPEHNHKHADEEVKTIKPGKGAELIIFGESSDKILYKLAQCCQPIPGDDVFGFITSGEGLKIHRTDCPNAAQMLAHYGHRIVKTKWAVNKEISFLSGVRITGLDDVGVVQKITNIISGELSMNMRSLSIDSKDGVFEGNIKVFVHDRSELDSLCQKLSDLEGVMQVERLEQIEE